MDFKEWLETTGPEQHPYNNFQRQGWFPFIHQANDERIDPKKVLKYKSPATYAKAAQKGGRQTEIATEKIVSQRINAPLLPFSEEVVRIIPNAVIVPGYELPPSEKYPKGIKREAARIAFVVTKGDDSYTSRRLNRVLAFYQGYKPSFGQEDIQYADPIGGLIVSNGHITHAWVHEEHRANPNNIGPWGNYKLYRSLREFAASIGYFDLEPGDELTSKSYRASDAKYQYRRAQELKSGQ
jgi:hypothetical protein